MIKKAVSFTQLKKLRKNIIWIIKYHHKQSNKIKKVKINKNMIYQARLMILK